VYLVFLSKAVDYAFYAGGIHKSVCESSPNIQGTPAEDIQITRSTVDAARDPHRNGAPPEKKLLKLTSATNGDTVTRSATIGFFASASETLEILCAGRGLNFDYGRDMAIPPDTRPLEKGPFLWATFKHSISQFVIADIIDTMWKSSPFGTPKGGSIFIQALPWPRQYLMSTIYHVSTGLMIICSFEAAYDLATLVCVGILSQSPKAWPPLFWHPFASQCLQEFWSIRWHQALRRTFLVFGGLPGSWISNKLRLRRGVGLVFGTFVASGLFHEIPLYANGRTWDWSMLQFFIAHAFFVLLERTWKKVTGRPVRGWLGRLWVFLTVVGLGQRTCEHFSFSP
jgi:hypothetical protein